MGVDIHMFIVDHNGRTMASEIYDGRNSDWFNNLQGRGGKAEYDYLLTESGIPDCITDGVIKEDYDKAENIGYYGFHYITVGEFNEWFKEYRPDIDAGWASTYEKWAIENKHYVPEYLPHYLDSDANINDYHFIEYTNKYDSSFWLYQFLNKEDTPNDYYIVYYFDC